MVKPLFLLSFLAFVCGCLFDQGDGAGPAGPGSPDGRDTIRDVPWTYLSEPVLPVDTLVRDFAPIREDMSWEYRAIRTGNRYDPEAGAMESFSDTSRILYQIQSGISSGDGREFAFRKRTWMGEVLRLDTVFTCNETGDSIFCPFSLTVNGQALDFPWHHSHTLKGGEVKPVGFGSGIRFLGTAVRSAPDTRADVYLMDGIGMVAADIDWRGRQILSGAYHIRMDLKKFNEQDLTP